MGHIGQKFRFVPAAQFQVAGFFLNDVLCMPEFAVFSPYIFFLFFKTLGLFLEFFVVLQGEKDRLYRKS